ncbi:MAG TPA: LPS export ABC transporter permease LptG [Candidatus Polarisedimenticolia bacterium]|nr:LPS export ABC transporter permease LptG [Candidatus Polarisedimenticolia bacterium]
MSRIFKYVFRAVFGPSLLGLAIYTFVLLMNAIFNVAEMAIRKNLPISAVLKILALSLPQFLALTIPMSVLLGTLIGIGRLSADSEIVALRACGIGYRRIIAPVLALGFLGWLVCSALVLWVEPRANFVRHRMAARLMLRSDLRKELKPHVFLEDLPGMLLYADNVYQGGSSLEHVLLYQTDPQGRDLITTARRGRLDYDSSTGNLRLLMEGGLTHRSDPTDPLDYQVYGADRQMVLREADAGFKLRLRLLKEPQQKNYREQTLPELSATWQKAEEIQHVPTRAKIRSSIDVIYHERFALPAACIVFTLIGFPLGIYNRRGGRSSGIVLSLAVVLLYWLILTTGENLATEARIPPVAALWAGNVLFSLAGIALIWRRERKELGEGRRTWWGFLSRRIQTARERRRARREDRARSRLLRKAPAAAPETVRARDRYVGGALFSTLIDRYILRSYLKLLLISGLSIYIIFLVVDFREMIDDVIQHQVPGQLILRFFKFRTPWVINQILPVACLVSTLLAFGLLARFNEITAMKAGGLSLYRVSLPVVGTTVLLSVFSFGIEGYVMPFSNQRASQIRDEIRGHSARSTTQPQRRWVLGKDGRFYNYRTYITPAARFLSLSGSGVFQGFSIYRLDPESFAIRDRIYAREAVWAEGAWALRDGWERKFDGGGAVVSFEPFVEKKVMLREAPSQFLEEVKTPDQMNYWQLRKFIKDLKRRGYSVQELLVDLYEKIAIPFVSLVMVILGLPFAFRTGKKGSLYGIGLSIGLVVVYYATFAVMSALGEIGFLPPFLAAWAPNILFAGAGTYMMLSLVRT